MAMMMMGAAAANGTTITWTGLAGDDNVFTAGNWSPDAAPAAGETLDFAGTTGLAPSLSGSSGTGLAVTGLTFLSGAGAFTLTGTGVYAISTGGITNSSTSLETISNSIALTGTQTWGSTSGSLLFNGATVNLGTALLTLSTGTNAIAISDSISGTGRLSKSGAGTLTLTGSNTFSGGVTLSTGTTVVGNSAALGTGTLSLSGGGLGVTNGSQTLANPVAIAGSAAYSGTGGNLTLTGLTTVSGNRVLTINGGVLTFANNISNATNSASYLTEKGTGLLVLGGSNSFSGFTLTSGTVAAESNYALGAGTVSLGSATFESMGGTKNIANAITLGGNTIFTGTDAITFNGTATMTGSRTLTIRNPSVTFGGAIVQSNGAARSLTISGTGTLILSGGAANTFTGTTTVASGTLVLDKTAGVNAMGGSLTLGNSGSNAVVQFDASNQVAKSATVTIGPAGLLNLQSYSDTVGALTMTGGNVTGTGTLGLTGNVTISAAGTTTATIGSSLALTGSRTFTVNNNGVSTDVDLTVSGAITDGTTAGVLTKAGAGTLALNGSDSYSGGTNLTAGELSIGSSNALGTGPLSLGSATLLSTAGPLKLTNALTLAGNTIFGGSNEFVFTGNESLTGTRTLTINNGGVTLDGAISQSAVGYGITEAGSGILTLGGSVGNSFTGTTTVNGGTLLLDKSAGVAIGGNLVVGSGTASALAQWLGPAEMASTGNVTVNSGATMDLDGNNQTITNLTLKNAATVTMESGTLGLLGTVTLSGTAATAGTIAGALDLSGTTCTFSVANSLASQDLIIYATIGDGALTKTGAGVLALDAANSYAGATTINAGTLQLGTNNAIGSASAITIASGATLDLNSYDETALSLSGSGAVTLETGTLALDLGGANTTYSGTISGNGGLVINGNGSLSLGGADSYTGPTLIESGTLQWLAELGAATNSDVTVAAGGAANLLADETVGSISGAGSINVGAGTLTAGGDNATTIFSGPISGTGNLIKAGSGLLTLTGSNSIGGIVTLADGSLTLTGASGSLSGASGVVIDSGATLTLDNTGTDNEDRINDSAAVTLEGGTFVLLSGSEGTTETVGALNATGGASNVEVVQNGPAGSSSALIFSSLGTIGAGATVNFSGLGGTLGVGTSGPHIYILGMPDGLIGGWATVGSDFAQYYADGVSAFSDYYLGSDGINVNDATKIVELSRSSPETAYTLTNAGTTTDDDLNLADVPAVILGVSSSQVLNLAGGGLIKSSTGATLIDGAGELTAGGTASGMLSISVAANQMLTIASSIINNAGPDGTYGDSDDGPVSLSMSDPGTLVLSGSNSYSGDTFLNGGTLVVSADDNLGGGAVIFGGGTLEITSGFAAGSGRAFSVTSGETGGLDIAAGQTLTIANESDLFTSGSGSTMYLAGGGSLVIPAANPDFDGTVEVDSGILQLQNAASLGSAGRITLNGGTLELYNDASTDFGNGVMVTGNSAIEAGPLDTAGAVTQTLGAISIGGEDITVTGEDGASLVLGPVALTGNATFDTATANVTLGAIGGNFGITKTGTATLILDGASSYTGQTNINEGTLLLGASGGVSAQSGVTVSAGAVFNLNNFGAAVASLSGSGNVALGGGSLTVGATGASSTYSGVISGSGGLNKDGAGTFTLGGANTYTGPTTINAGVVGLGEANAIPGSSAFTIAYGAALDLNGLAENAGSVNGGGTVNLGSGGALTIGEGDASSAFSGMISGSGSVTKVGAGTLALSGSSSFAGTVTLDDGIVSISDDTQLGNAGNGLTFDGGTLQAAASFATSRAMNLNAGGVIDTGSNTLVVQGSISGAGGLTKISSGNLIVAGSNSYSGGTTLDAGVLTAENNSALGSGPVGFNGGGLASDNDAIEIGNALSFAGSSNQITGNNSLTLSGSAGGSGTLDINLGDATKAVTVSPGQAGGFAPGAIDIMSGTLLLGRAQAIGAATNLILDGGVFSMADLTGADQTLGALTLDADSTIDFSGVGGGDTVEFSSVNLNGFTLTIDDWSGDMYSESNVLDEGSSSQDRILFTELTGNPLNVSFFDNTGAELGLGHEVDDGTLLEVVPIPEPSGCPEAAVFLLLLGCSARVTKLWRAGRKNGLPSRK
jgi:autotransporter-associated beta strand protein